MKVLVTGAKGLIGQNVMHLLKDKGIPFIGDITNEKAYQSLSKVDAVIHLAAITDTTLKDDNEMIRVNFGGFKNILHYCRKKNIRLVYASSAAVYGCGGKPLSAYASSKFLCEDISRGYSNAVGLRYFNVYGYSEEHKGNSASMIYQLYKQMKAGKRPRIFKYGEQKRDFIYVKDAAEATVNALTKGEGVIDVGTGVATSFNDVVDILNDVMKTDLMPEYIDNPYPFYQDYTCSNNKVGKYSLEEGVWDYESYLH